MRDGERLIAAALVFASLSLNGCQRDSSAYFKVEPSEVTPIKGSEFSRVTLTEKAMERLAIKTEPLREAEASRSEDKVPRAVVPYSAVLYAPHGETFVYTSPQPRTFVRHAVNVDYIEGDLAVLNEGPPSGTEVVTVGTAELFGAEVGVGH